MKCELVNIDAKQFPHLEAGEIGAMREREISNVGFCFKLIEENEAPFHVFIDIDKESVHVRHIGGAFAWKWGFIENLCGRVAHETKLNKITVRADKDFMFHALKKLGFEKIQGDLYGKDI